MIGADDVRAALAWLDSMERAAKRKGQREHADEARRAAKVIRDLFGGDGKN